jgi:hypothetical protein
MGNDLHERALARRELATREARRSFPAFMSYVFGWDLADFHVRWVEAVEQYNRVVILAPPEHGKTTLTIGYVLWRLGLDPNLRICLVHATHSQAVRPMAAIREHIQSNARLRDVFPDLQPSTGARARWTDHEFIVRRTLTSKDASVLGVGLFGSVLGIRVDILIADDVVDFSNSLTAAARQKVSTWWRSTAVGRVVGEGKVLAVGNCWAYGDLLDELSRSGEYRVVRCPALDDAGTPLWPSVWPVERLEQRRREVGEVEFSRTMLLKVLSDATSRFKPEWFEFSMNAARDAGLTLMDSYDGPHPTFTGVDVAIGTTPKHDLSSLVTIALLPDKRRHLLSVEAGRWDAPTLVGRLRDVQRRFQSKVRVETNGVQGFVRDFLAADGVQVESHITTAQKKALGLEALAVEFQNGLWLLPDAPGSRTLVRELLAYSPSSHIGDRAVGLWLAREAAAASGKRDLFPMPFITTSTHYRPVTTGSAVVAAPSEFPEDAWSDTTPWFR